MVLVAKMRQHRAVRLARRLMAHRHAAAVVGHGSADAREGASGAPRQQAAPAVADHAHFAALDLPQDRQLLGCKVNRRLYVLHHLWRDRFGGCFQGHPCVDVFGRVAQIHARFYAVKSGGRDRQVALCSVAVSHRLDVTVDAKNLL